MVIYNAATKELTAKIVYYGPGLCGKTTNLKVLHDRLEPGTAGKLLNLQTQTDRTIYFDLLPVELGDIKGYKIRFQLATVPGQTAFNETRRVVLKGVDGIVFVADSQWTMLPKNLESWQNLKDNLKTNEITFESIPVVVQYNKRDLADILAVDAMQEALGLSSYPFVEAVASAGRGVTETFKLISKLTFVDLLRRLQGRRGEEAGELAAPPVAEEIRQDDLQSWKDSLLNRESQATPIGPRERPSRPLSLVPPVADLTPFDTTELSRGVDDDEAPSPFAVSEPPDLEPATALDDLSPAHTMQMDAIHLDDLRESSEPVESLSEADEIDVEVPIEVEPPPELLLPAEPVAAARLDSSIGHRLPVPELAGGAGEASERRAQAVAALQERLDTTTAHVHALADRLSGIERGVSGLHETVGSLLQRIGHVESEASRHPEVERSLKGVEARLADFEERLRSETTHQRKDADDVAMALRGLNEKSQTLDQQLSSLSHQLAAQQGTLMQLSGLGDRLPQLEGQVARLPELDAHLGALKDTVARLPELEAQLTGLRETALRITEIEAQIKTVLHEHHELESTLEEKTHQGRREAEDIRSQIAPLLEERVRRHESDALLFAEMERLRESLADSLHDLAERVRSRIRE